MSRRTASRRTASLAVTAVALAGLSTASTAVTAGATPGTARHASAEHVLLLSIDGLHQSDLAYYVGHHPTSALARLVDGGTEYTHAQTTFPSDSFPGMVAQLTGAPPGTSGVYYDDTYNHALLPAGTTDCATATPGTEVSWTEAADRSQNPIALDAGEQLPGAALAALPTDTSAQTLAARSQLTSEILAMTPDPQSLLDPASLPVDPATCLPEYPHKYLKVNTVFDVVHAAHERTAWSDKHPAYEILSGPSGTGIDDLFTPEINSIADSAGDDWTKDNALTQEYDGFKVAAVLNEIDGYDHSGTRHVGTPAVFGMNFQTLSTAQKLPTSDGLRGGYDAAGAPGPLVRRAMNFVDSQVGALMTRIDAEHLGASTTIVLSAKHGQSPIDPATLRRVDDGAIIDALDAGWTAAGHGSTPLVTFATDDDGMLLWLSDRSAAAYAFVQAYLLGHSAPANTIDDPAGVYSTTVASSGLSAVYTGRGVDRLMHARRGDTHAPDVIGIAQHGVVYTGGVKKIAEHGGDAPDDRDVALVVYGAGVHHAVDATSVQTTRIAPTILALLGLDPRALDAVRIDHTQVLPGL